MYYVLYIGGMMDPCDCDDDERCVVSGELGRRECEEGNHICMMDIYRD